MNLRYRQLVAAVCIVAQVSTTMLAEAPAWWLHRNVIVSGRDADDFAVANLGQLKTFASKAAAHMNEVLTGGAGEEINGMIESWRLHRESADDYSAATIGQSKAVASKFYNRLQAQSLFATQPWLSSNGSADDFSPINVGQLKTLFSFGLPETLIPTSTAPVRQLSSLTNRGERISYSAASAPIHSIPDFLRTTGVTGGVLSGGGATPAGSLADVKIYVQEVSASLSKGGRRNLEREGVGDYYSYHYHWTIPSVVPFFGVNGGENFNSWNPSAASSFSWPVVTSYAKWAKPYEMLSSSEEVSSHEYERDYSDIEYETSPQEALPTPQSAWFNLKHNSYGISSKKFELRLDSGAEPLDVDVIQEFRVSRRVYKAQSQAWGWNEEPRGRDVYYFTLTLKSGEQYSPATEVNVPPAPKGWRIEKTIERVSASTGLRKNNGGGSSGPGFTFQDIAGPAFRKIGLNGVPLPDEQPQKNEETDQPSESSFIDAYSLGLEHSTSDIYVHLGSSDLPLTVRRCSRDFTWTPRADVNLEHRIDLPFGPGWSSGICSYVELRADDQDVAISVADEAGGGQQFLRGDDGQFHALPYSSSDAKSFMNTLIMESEGGLEHFVYTKKFGTRLEFEATAVSSEFVSGDGAPGTKTVGEKTAGQDFSLGTTLNQGSSTWSSLMSATPGSNVQIGANGQALFSSGANQVAVAPKLPSADQPEPPGLKWSNRSHNFPNVREPFEVRAPADSPATSSVRYTNGFGSGVFQRSPMSQGISFVQTATGKPIGATASYSGKNSSYVSGYHQGISDTRGLFVSRTTHFLSPQQTKQLYTSISYGARALVDVGSRFVESGGLSNQADWVQGYSWGGVQGASRLLSVAGAANTTSGPSLTGEQSEQLQDVGYEIGRNAGKLSELNFAGNAFSRRDPLVKTTPEGHVTSFKMMTPSGRTASLTGQTTRASSTSGTNSNWVSDSGSSSIFRLLGARAENHYSITTAGGGNATSYTYSNNSTNGPSASATFRGGNQVSLEQSTDAGTSGGDDGPPKIERFYHRLKSITDRFGNKLEYHYPNDLTLIPDTITDTQRNLKLQISHDGRRISKISDPLGKEVNFRYRDVNFDHESALLLERVTYADQSFVHYGYDHDGEDDFSGNKVHHISPAAITNPDGQTFSFRFAFAPKVDASGQGNSFGLDGSKPRWVKSITLPNGKSVKFNNQKVINFPTHDLAIGSVTNSVTDVDGVLRTYVFGDARVDSLPRGELDTLNERADGIDTYVLFTSMEIHLGEGLMERFEFDPEAGLALKKAIDLSGNVTTYEYRDVGPLYEETANQYGMPHRNGFKVAAPLDLFKHYNDPTAKINALGQRTEYTYDPATRIMNSVKDPLGRVTEFTIQPVTGLRTEERHYDASHTLLSKTSYVYGNANFPGFMTARLAEKQGADPAWLIPANTTYVADTKGRVATETIEGTGSTTHYSYDANGNKTLVEDPLGRLTSFSYDDRGRLKSAVYAQGTPDEARKDYTYDLRGNKVVEVDENNGITFYTYDEMNRRTSSTFDLNGNGAPDGPEIDIVTSTTYNVFGQPLTSTDANGRLTKNDYDGLGRIASTRTFSAPGDQAQTTYLTEFFYVKSNSNNVGGSVFDSSTFKPTCVIDPRGFQTVTLYDKLYRPVEVSRQLTEDDWAKTLTEYDDAGNVVKVTDSLGHATITAYDGKNQPTRVTYADGTFVTSSYTSTGLKWQTTDELGRISQTIYDAASRPVQSIAPAVVDALTGATVIPTVETTYDLAGNAVTSKDPRGNTTTTVYDARNRAVEIISPAVTDSITGQSVTPVVRKYYDAAGKVVRVTDPLGNNTDTVYDLAGRAVEVYAPAVVTADNQAAYTETVIRTTYDMVGNVLTVTDPDGRVTRNFYDQLNHLVQTTDPSMVATVFGYDHAGNRTSVTDGKGNTTTFVYDGLNRLLSETMANGVKRTFTYNEVNMLTGNGMAYTQYDARNRPLALEYYGLNAQGTWVKRHRAMAYDAVGNLLSVTEDEDHTSVSYTYDSLNRIVSERMGTSSTSVLQSSYGFDVAGNRTVARYATGSVLVSTFDALNRCIQQDHGLISPGTISGPIAQPLTGLRRSTWEHDLAGRVRAQGLANGTRVENQHDAQGRLLTRTLLGPMPGNGSPRMLIGQQTYLHDASGNLRKMVERTAAWLGVRTVTMTYDDSLRLKKEVIRETTDTTITSDYAYDAVGNRTMLIRTDSTKPAPKASTYAYNAMNQLTGFVTTGEAPVSYTYDSSGNRTSRTQGTKVDTYTWDTLNRLVRVTHPESNGTLKSYRYDYDYRVRRVLRQEGAETTLLMFSGGTSVAELGLATSDFARWQSGVYNHQAQAMQPAPATFTLAKSFVRGSDMGGGVGGLLYSEKQTATAKPGFTVSGGSLGGTWNGGTAYTASASFNHYNGRGDVVAKTDATGAITWTGAYEAYGKRTKETGVNDDRQRANTKDEDPTGLLNEGMRYRDLETGTWLSRDPAGFVDGPNLYAYVQQNPWTHFDAHGLSIWIKGFKVLKNGGNWAQTTAGLVDDFSTFIAPESGFGTRFCSAWSMLSEVLPASVGDVKDGYKYGKKLLSRADDVKDVTKPGGMSAQDMQAQAKKLAKELEDRKQAALNPPPSTDPRRRGMDNEKKVLDDRGDVKNNEAFETSHGTTIPDINNPKEIGDIKDVKVQADTKQMKAQREVAAAEGKDHVVVTGDKTKVTAPLLNSGSKIERRKDIGPQ